MPRTPRGDAPGVWHHVMNRGLARRTVFESERDIRYFLSRLARSVRAGLLEVHAYCVLTTHFHLMVRSPRGELAEAMRRIQNEYVRWFNRARRRDGTLYRGRYRSRAVHSLAYREILVRYIDANPVSAGLVPDARLYPHGSARWYARERGPIWLSREWVEAWVRATSGAERSPEAYARFSGGTLSPSIERLVERRLKHASSDADPLDELLGAAPREVLGWMRRKATLADGTSVGLPVSDGSGVIRVILRARERDGAWQTGRTRPVDIWAQVQVALLRDICAASFPEAGLRTALSPATAWNLYQRHLTSLNDETYAQRVASLTHELLSEEYGVGAEHQRSG